MGVRVITSVDDDNNEQVIFTEDFESPAEDFFNSNMKITSDSTLDESLHFMFPLETVLERVL